MINDKDILYSIEEDVYNVFNDLSVETCEYADKMIQEEIEWYHEHIIWEPDDIEGFVEALIDNIVDDIDKEFPFKTPEEKEERRVKALAAALKHFEEEEENVC